jgi:hypothetical protein
MPAAEIPLELFGLALESTRGTAITPPTHLIPVSGVITPFRTKYRPEEQRGTLEQNYRAKTVRTGSNWAIPDSLLDPNYAPVLFNMVAKANSTPSTPGGGTLSRLWTYTPTITSDDLKAATLYGGDPNVQIWQAAYCMADELTVTADATERRRRDVRAQGHGLLSDQGQRADLSRRDPRRSADARRDAVLDGCRIRDRHDRDHREIH